MKFKITKYALSILQDKFDKNKNPFEEIELEPVIDTATQAIRENELKNEAFKQGYERGKREGYYEGRERGSYCDCRCNIN